MQIDERTTKVAFICCERYGDLLCTLPLIWHWGKTYPQTSITIVASERCAALLPFISGYDNTLIIPDTSIRRKDIKLKTLWNTRKDRKAYFDLAVSCSLGFSPQINTLLFAFKAPQRVACVKNQWYILTKYLINHPVYPDQVKQGLIHEALSRLKILFPGMSQVPGHLYPRLTLPQQPLPNLPGLHNLVQSSDSPLVFISVSNNRAASFLGIRGYIEILNTLYADVKFRLVISCMPQDLSSAEAVVNQVSALSCVICTPDLLDLLLVLNKVDLLFIGDGGVMHMGAAFDKLQVVLFGKTKTVQWHPLSEKAICLEHPEHVIKIPQNVILEALRTQLQKCRKI